MNKATNTLSEFITLIAFPLQQWLHGRALMLGDTTLPAWLNSKEIGTYHSGIQ